MRSFFSCCGFVCFFTFLLVSNPNTVFSQSNFQTKEKNKRLNNAIKNSADNTSKNTIYIEGAGAGGYGSLNYERLYFLPTKNKSVSKLAFSFRIGASTYYLNDFTDTFNPEIIVPVALHFLYGKNHKLEVGAGQTVTSFIRASSSDFQPKRDLRNHAHFILGYRYQKNEGGLMFRIAYTPLLEFNTDFQHWGGLSVGYAF